MMRRSASLPKWRARRWCCRRVRPAYCRTRIRRTCMSAARKARSAAISRWPMPSLVIVIGSRCGLSGRLLRHRLQVREACHQHQRRFRRRAALQQHDRARGRYLRGDRPALRASEGATANKSEWLKACAAKEGRMVGVQNASVSRRRRRSIAVWQRNGAVSAGGDQGGRRFRQEHRCRQVLRCRRRAGQRLPDRRGRPDRRYLHRNRRLLYGLRRERAARFRAGRQAALRHRLYRRRLLHDEPAGADRRRGAQGCAA